MFDWKLISSDSHVVEPPDLWAERMDRSFRDRGPQVVTEPDGDWWIIDGTRGNSFQGGAQVGKRFEHADQLRPAARFSEVRPGAYQPAEFLRENEDDGIWASVIYPTAGLQLFRVPDLALLSACFRAYNDWLAELLPDGARTPAGHRPHQRRGRRRGSSRAGPGAPAGASRRHDHRGAARGEELRPRHVRTLLGGRPGSGHADQPAHRHEPARAP